VGEKIQFCWNPGHCGVEVNKRADLEAKQSIKEADIVNYYYQWQILKPRGKRSEKRSFAVSVKTPKGTEEKLL
jgi:ribonuclease HI